MTGVPSLSMIDSVSLRSLETDPSAQVVAAYDDGNYALSSTQWTDLEAKFPNAVVLHITVNPANNAGDVYDYENGNGAPNASLCARWLNLRHLAGHPCPAIYFQKSNSGPVLGAIQAAGIEYLWGQWIAEWTGESHDAGGWATQWADKGSIDTSTVFRGPWLTATRGWTGPTVHPAPIEPAIIELAPQTGELEDMAVTAGLFQPNQIDTFWIDGQGNLIHHWFFHGGPTGPDSAGWNHETVMEGLMPWGTCQGPFKWAADGYVHIFALDASGDQLEAVYNGSAWVRFNEGGK